MHNRDYEIELYKKKCAGDEWAAEKLEHLQQRRKQYNEKRNAQAKKMGERTKAAGKAIADYMTSCGFGLSHNDATPTHRRLKISVRESEADIETVNDLPLMALAVKHGVAIKLDITNVNKTRAHQATSHCAPFYCIRITPGEPDVQVNI